MFVAYKLTACAIVSAYICSALALLKVRSLSGYPGRQSNYNLLAPKYDTIGYETKRIHHIVLKCARQKKDFGDVIKRMNDSSVLFYYRFRPVTEDDLTYGELTTNGDTLFISISDPDLKFGTPNGLVGIIFEETWHAKQFLDGQAVFIKDTCWKDGKAVRCWKATSSLMNEIEAKMFVIGQFTNDLAEKYTYSDDGKEYTTYTQLGWLRQLEATEKRVDFLKNGSDSMPAWDSNKKIFYTRYGGPYYNFPLNAVYNDLKVPTKNDTIFGYPKR